MSIEQTILNCLVTDEGYGRKIIPFVKREYFVNKADAQIFDLISDYVKKYNDFPSKEALLIDLSNKDGIHDDVFKEAQQKIAAFEKADLKMEWLVDETEKFCQERDLYNAIYASIKILDDKTGKLSKGSIPKIINDALAISFDTHIGHSWLDDAAVRFDYYHENVKRIPFHLEMMNKITGGGLPSKTLTVFMAGPNVGKSQLMCNFAADNLRDGKNVLYITLEMSEFEIAKRIDANLLDVAMDDIVSLPKDVFDKKIARVKEKTKGKIIIKEYPTAGASVGNFRHLINELALKQKFTPDIIYIDYLNIMASYRVKMSNSVNTYTYVKSISEEVRGLAVELDVPIVSATQLNREGSVSSDVGMENTAESFGLPATVDMLVALMINEEYEREGRMAAKQLKSRFGDKSKNTRFFIGVDRQKMRFFDIDQDEPNYYENDLDPTKSVMDNGKFMSEEEERHKKSYGRSLIEGLR